jgi:hypothetical protein
MPPYRVWLTQPILGGNHTRAVCVALGLTMALAGAAGHSIPTSNGGVRSYGAGATNMGSRPEPKERGTNVLRPRASTASIEALETTRTNEWGLPFLHLSLSDCGAATAGEYVAKYFFP